MRVFNKRRPNNLREHRINNEIRAKVIFLINEKGEKIGNISTYEALKAAREVSMDLVQIVEKAETPVCKIMDYGRFCFENKKNKQKAKKEAKSNEKKEVQLNPAIDSHDLGVKVKRAVGFLNAGHKVSFVMRFRGRQNAHPEIGLDMLKKIVEDTKEIAKAEIGPKIEEKKGLLLLTPIKKK